MANEWRSLCSKACDAARLVCVVVAALENLGFGSFTGEVSECMNEAKEVALKKRRQSTKLENLGIPEEELLRQQQELFAKVMWRHSTTWGRS